MNGVLFPLGEILITDSARDRLCEEDLALAVARHAVASWGELSKSEQEKNEQVLIERHPLPLRSAHRDSKRVLFFIVTDANRSKTTILLPNEYVGQH